jgi:hypothetical protein
MEKLTMSAGNVKTGALYIKKTTRKSPSRKAAVKKRKTAGNPPVPSREAVAYASDLSIRLKCADGLMMKERICWSYWGESSRECFFSRSLQSYQNTAVSNGAILINRVDPEFDHLLPRISSSMTALIDFTPVSMVRFASDDKYAECNPVKASALL